jgi:membrane protein DedA with SNARE-associated domain
MSFDAIGNIAWAIIVTGLGYFLGSRIPGLSHYVDLVLALIIVFIALLVLYHLAKDPKIRMAVFKKFKH